MDDRSPGLVAMHPFKTTTFTLAGLAVLLLVLVQFLPWLSITDSGSTPGGSFGGFTVPSQEYERTIEGNTWDLDAEASSNGQSSSSDESWYDDGFDDADGIGLIRAAAPILVVGAVAVLAGVLLAWFQPTVGGIVLLVGGIVTLVATILFAVGLNGFFDDTDYTWHASFYMALVASVASLAAGVMTMMARGTRVGSATL